MSRSHKRLGALVGRCVVVRTRGKDVVGQLRRASAGYFDVGALAFVPEIVVRVHMSGTLPVIVIH